MSYILNYDEYYSLCKKKYNGNEKNVKYSIENLTFLISHKNFLFDYPSDYDSRINKIYTYCNSKINNNVDIFDDKKNTQI